MYEVVPLVPRRVPVASEAVYVGSVASSVTFVASVVAAGVPDASDAVRVSSVAPTSVGVAVVFCSIVAVVFSSIGSSVDVTVSVIVGIPSVFISVKGVELTSVSGSGKRETFVAGGKGTARASGTPGISLPTDGPPTAPLPCSAGASADCAYTVRPEATRIVRAAVKYPGSPIAPWTSA